MYEQPCGPCLDPGGDAMAATLGHPARAAEGEQALAGGVSAGSCRGDQALGGNAKLAIPTKPENNSSSSLPVMGNRMSL